MKITIPTSGYSYDRKVKDSSAKLRIKCIGEYAVEVFIGTGNTATAKTRIEPGQFADFSMKALKLSIGTWGNGSVVSLFKVYPDGVEDACDPDGYSDPANSTDTVDAVARQKLSHVNYDSVSQTTTITGTTNIKNAQINKVSYAVGSRTMWSSSMVFDAETVTDEYTNTIVAVRITHSPFAEFPIPLGTITQSHMYVIGTKLDDSQGYPTRATWIKVQTKGTTTETEVICPLSWAEWSDDYYYYNWNSYYVAQQDNVWTPYGTKVYYSVTCDYIYGSSVVAQTSVDLADYGWTIEDIGAYQGNSMFVFINAKPFSSKNSSIVFAACKTETLITDSNSSILPSLFYDIPITQTGWYGIYSNNTSWKTWGFIDSSATVATYGTNLSTIVSGLVGRLKFENNSFAVLPTDTSNLGNIVITLKRNGVQIGTKTVPITASTWAKSGTKYQSPAIVMSVDDVGSGQKVYTLEVTASAGTLSTGAPLGKITVEDIG